MAALIPDIGQIILVCVVSSFVPWIAITVGMLLIRHFTWFDEIY